MTSNYKTRLNDITTFIFDVDGVMTDSSVILIGGDMVRTVSTRDGYAIRFALKRGFRVCVISGGTSTEVKLRMNYLGVEDCYLGVGKKMDVYNDYLNTNNLAPNEVLYVGDDLPDYFVMQKSGVSVCPKDAATEILGIADYVSTYNGGHGVVRDIIEQTLRVQNKWFDPTLDKE